ncbi:meiotic recombination protein REC114 isoform X2 [Nothobranchius furzeri]|uniref:REC114 meiotic recombination protein n=1 Tax=Nothobranchius furzeri TaxID=105023 RepID=A0A8C6LB79_NOTFU|nr:meiotic recombination protein REC114 isoform X2 [Nothobranchius furzeri]KAF7211835.1 transcript variant X2 [Nothobranchius furzeri]
METTQTWKLKRYGRLVPQIKQVGGKSFKMFESNNNKPDIVLTMLESGYLLISQGQKSLDTISLLSGSDLIQVQHKTDNLMFKLKMKGENRMIRMQFDGGSTAEAINQCSSAVQKLMEYVPVTSIASIRPNQPPTEVSAAETQVGEPSAQEKQSKSCQGQTVGTEPEVVQGPLSIKRLTQHFLGETSVTLPQIYHHSSLAQGDLEPFLRVCLLDPSFHAFVENVEEELKKIREE